MKNGSIVIERVKSIKLTTVLIIAILILIFMIFRLRDTSMKIIQDNTNIINNLNSELVVTRNEHNQEVAKRESLVLTNSDLLMSIKSKDEAILYLQRQVSKYESENKKLNSVVVALTETVVKYSDSLANVIVGDTIINNITYHTYERELDMFDNWITGSVMIGYNKFSADLSIKNRYSVAMYEEKQGLFKPRKTFVEIVNDNPYTSTQDIRDFQVAVPKQNKTRCLFIGGGLGAGIMYLIFKAAAK